MEVTEPDENTAKLSIKMHFDSCEVNEEIPQLPRLEIYMTQKLGEYSTQWLKKRCEKPKNMPSSKKLLKPGTFFSPYQTSKRKVNNAKNSPSSIRTNTEEEKKQRLDMLKKYSVNVDQSNADPKKLNNLVIKVSTCEVPNDNNSPEILNNNNLYNGFLRKNTNEKGEEDKLIQEAINKNIVEASAERNQRKSFDNANKMVLEMKTVINVTIDPLLHDESMFKDIKESDKEIFPKRKNVAPEAKIEKKESTVISDNDY